MATNSAWVFGLQQNSETRTNLALACAGLATEDPNAFRIELFDGTTGTQVNAIDGIRLESQGRLQVQRVLDQYASGTSQGYAHITRTEGENPFIDTENANDGTL